MRRANVSFLRAGMAVPRKTISQKNSTAHWSGLIFEGYNTKTLAECLIPTKSKPSQTLKDQFASAERRRYRLEGNGHPWRKPRRFEAKLC
jgi:hypothetical protein